MSVKVSVVLARHEDPGRALAALEAQEPESPGFEVLISGSGQGCPAATGLLKGGRELRIVEAGGGSIGAAWNAAAAAGRGEFLVLVPARAVPGPRLLIEQLGLHCGTEPVVGVGKVLSDDPVPPARPRPQQVASIDMPASMAHDQVISVDRDFFLRESGCSTELSWGPEIELVHRLASRGAIIRLATEAVGYRLATAEDRTGKPARYAAGQGSVRLYRHAPELLPELELGAFRSSGSPGHRLRQLLLELGGPSLPSGIGSVLPRAWRHRWRRFEHDYHFWRGVRHADGDDRLWRTLARAPVILMYHAIGQKGEPPGCYIVPEDVFARQMAWLAARRYHVIALHELLEYRRRCEPPPPRSVVITFDDGYADNHALAYPILRRHGFRATFFLVSGCLGASNSWDTVGELAGRRMMSWDDVRDLASGGMEIGAHTRHHPVLPDLDPGQLAEELRGGRRDLEEGLGRPIQFFAYPFGRLDAATTQAVADAGFALACCSRSGVNDPVVSDLLLRRVEVRGTDSWATFALAVHRGWAARRKQAS